MILHPHWLSVLHVFYHSLCLVFSFSLTLSFEEQEFKILMKSNLSSFILMIYDFCVCVAKNLYLIQGHKVLSSIFLPEAL